jgi:ADP-ribose pyrophosphatase YjhB (NUDIX family)
MPMPMPMPMPTPGATPDPQSDDSRAELVRRAAVVLAGLAQSGLTYHPTGFEAARYRQVAAVAAELLDAVSADPAGDWAVLLGQDVGHATPKVDVRGALVDDRERILLLRERADGRWSLPGGWADPGDTPAQATVREIREETGYPAEAMKLVGCWDRDTRGHRPPLPVSVTKLFFLCRQTGDPVPPDDLETLEIGWFGLDELPPLSTGRVTQAELATVLAHHRDPSLPTEFD